MFCLFLNKLCICYTNKRTQKVFNDDKYELKTYEQNISVALIFNFYLILKGKREHKTNLGIWFIQALSFHSFPHYKEFAVPSSVHWKTILPFYFSEKLFSGILWESESLNLSYKAAHSTCRSGAVMVLKQIQTCFHS